MQERNLFIHTSHSTNSDKSKFYMITTILLAILLFVGGIIMYKYAKFDGVSQQVIKANYIEKTKVTFDDLPFDIKEQYIDKKRLEYVEKDKIKSLEKMNSELTKMVEDLQKDLSLAKAKLPEANPFANEIATVKQVEVNATKETPKEIAQPKPIAQDDKRYTKVVYDTPNQEQQQEQSRQKDKDNKDLVFVKQMSCDDMGAGRYALSNVCKKELQKFLKSYSEKNVFEIIPTVNDEDFALVSKFRALNDKLPPNEKFSKDRIDLLNQYANTGLGKFRSNEIGWLIRKQVGKNTNIKYAPYQIHTKDERGIVIKVYK